MKELGYLSLVFLLVGYLSRLSRLPSIHDTKCDLQYYFPLRKNYLAIHFTIFLFSPVFSISFVKICMSRTNDNIAYSLLVFWYINLSEILT